MGLKCSVYAFDNLDGLASASIMLRWFKFKNFSYKINFINYRNIDEVFEDISGLTGTLLFILDFPPEQIPQLKQKILSIEKKGNKIIYWNSHLKTSQPIREMLMEHVKYVDIDEGRCSAYMVAQRFMQRDKISSELRSIAHDMEFWLREDARSIKLADIIASGFSKKDLVETLAKGVFWSAKFEKLRKEYLDKKEKALSDILKNLQLYYYSPHNFGFGFASSLLSTADAGQKLLEDARVDIAVSIYRDGKISFRRREGVDLDLVQLAKLFDGGGHPYAAGGRITDTTLPIGSLDKFKIAVSHIDKRLRDFLCDRQYLTQN